MDHLSSAFSTAHTLRIAHTHPPTHTHSPTPHTHPLLTHVKKAAKQFKHREQRERENGAKLPGTEG